MSRDQVRAFLRFFKRHGYSRKKKTGHAVEEQSRPGLAKKRAHFIDKYPESGRFLFLDETGVSTNMTRSHGRCKIGKRLKMPVPHCHRVNLSCVAAISNDEIVSSWTFKGAMNTKKLVLWMKYGLAKHLRQRYPLIMDNLSKHKTKAVEETIKRIGARLVFLPPHSADFNPIEKAFAKLKAMLRKAEKQTILTLKQQIKRIFNKISPEKCDSYFRYCYNETVECRDKYRLQSLTAVTLRRF